MLGCFNLLDTEYKMTDDIQAKCIIIFDVYLNSIYSIYIYWSQLIWVFQESW